MASPNQHRRNERGQVMVLFALLAVVLFGLMALAIDGGLMYFERRVMQNAADAAALAGARVMARTFSGGGVGAADGTIRATAQRYHQANHKASLSATLRVDYVDGSGNVVGGGPAGARGVRTTSTANQDALFSRVLGFSVLRPSAQATALFGPAGSGVGLAPIAVDDQLQDSYRLQPAGGVGGGNFVNVSILDTTKFGTRQDVLDAIRSGMRDSLSLGGRYATTVPDFIRWRPVVVAALRDRINRGAARGDSPTSFTADSPQLLVVPTVQGGFPNAPDPVRLYRFRAFFLQEVDPNGNWARGVFVSAPLGQGTIDRSAPYGGVTVTRLVR